MLKVELKQFHSTDTTSSFSVFTKVKIRDTQLFTLLAVLDDGRDPFGHQTD